VVPAERVRSARSAQGPRAKSGAALGGPRAERADRIFLGPAARGAAYDEATMHVAFFAIDARFPGDDAAALDQFLDQHRIVSVEKELVREASGSYWAVCVTWVQGTKADRPQSKGGKVDYREVLSPEDFTVYAALRDYRNQLSTAQGLKVWAIATNEQLGAMARDRPTTIAELRKIDGFGPARVEKYGEALLTIIRSYDDGGGDRGGGDAPA
jgi:hypothetical protein